MRKYDPKEIEKKWQKYWETNKIFEVIEDPNKQKFYSLIEFPYPSAVGLHVGHPRPFTAMDIVSRKRRMEGYNVLYPIGFDAFGLPTENYAIKTGQPPAEVTKKNIANFTRQLKALGYSFDWDRQVNTSDPAYYKWTQWQFLQFFKHGLAYKKNQPINWCPKDKTGLANEEVVTRSTSSGQVGCCERCGTAVEKRDKEQWMLGITKYADKLLDGLKEVDYIPRARVQQENWIGRSEGAIVKFGLSTLDFGLSSQTSKDQSLKSNDCIEVFTTRPDTIFGVTFLAISADLAQEWLGAGWGASTEVKKYVVDTIAEQAKANNREEEAAKTGIDSGIKAINPVNGAEIPVWVTNYVLGGVGTGAIMGVSAHDERDWEFARKFNLSIKEVLKGGNISESAFTGDGDHINSDFLNNFSTVEAKTKIIAWLEEKCLGRAQVNYKLRDWVFSRQHYWGEPIPLVWCEQCKNKKQKVLIIHGFEGTDTSNWYPWMKEKLESSGFEVFTPSISTAAHPTVESWEQELAPYIKQLGADDIIIGHSLGSKAALHLLEKNNKKIKHLYLVASAIGEMLERDWDLYRREWKGADVDALKKFWETPVNLKIATAMVGKVSVILSDDDPWILKKTHNNLPAEWQFSLWHGFGHFTSTEAPELLALFLESKNQNPGWIPLPESELPLKLPPVEKYQPTDTGESPLAAMTDWVNTKCPHCGGPAKRETDTMPNWAGSSWYFLRYCDPHNDTDFFKAPAFNFRPAIEATDKDKKYFAAFKELYTDLSQDQISLWMVNRFLVNGLNRVLTIPFRTIAFMALYKDAERIAAYLSGHGYSLTDPNIGGDVYEKNGIRAEVIFIHEENGMLYSFTRRGAKQDLQQGDLPLVDFGNLFGFNYRTVSPVYNLAHYKYIAENEAEDRKGLNDQDKIEFLEEWVNSKNAKVLYWNQVDWYNGGMEHTVLHLLYSRFWHQFLFDLGLVPTREPYKKRTSHGMILGPDGEKMSKSRGNVINPDEMIEKFGADTFRAYIAFMGPFDQAVMWDTNGLVGVRRWLEKVWALQEKVDKTLDSRPLILDKNDIAKVQSPTTKVQSLLHQTIKKVSDDIEAMRFNTAIAKLMELVNEMTKPEYRISNSEYRILIQLISPFAPHMAEELWEKFGPPSQAGEAGDGEPLAYSCWPQFDPALAKEKTITIAVQINGKVRDELTADAEISEDEVKKLALKSEKVQKWLGGKAPKKVIYVPGKLVSIVI